MFVLYVIGMCLCTRKCFANVTDANCNTETFQLNSQQNNTKCNNDFDGKIDFFLLIQDMVMSKLASENFPNSIDMDDEGMQLKFDP